MGTPSVSTGGIIPVQERRQLTTRPLDIASKESARARSDDITAAMAAVGAPPGPKVSHISQFRSVMSFSYVQMLD